MGKSGANGRDAAAMIERLTGKRKALSKPKMSDEARDCAAMGKTAGEGIRTLDVQLGKLAFYH